MKDEGEDDLPFLAASIIFLSGLALLPFAKLSADPLGWQRYAGIYNPDLDVNPNKGFPGTAFVYVGSGYPSNALATVYSRWCAVRHCDDGW